VSWGRHHTSKTAAHRSLGKAFWVLSLASFVLHWKLFGFTFVANRAEQPSVYDRFMASIGRQAHTRSNWWLTTVANTAHRLKGVSKNPVISVTTSDVLFSTVSLLAWTFTRDLDVEAMLDNSVLSFLTPNKTEKHVAFDRKIEKVVEESLVPEPEDLPTETPRRRGRPRKGTLTNGASTARRSTRKTARTDYESEAENTYEPPESTKQAVAQTESDGATTAEDLIHGGEATALALCLTFLGGLGQLASSVLGAEVTTAGE
jgi:hypothetical protein